MSDDHACLVSFQVVPLATPIPPRIAKLSACGAAPTTEFRGRRAILEAIGTQLNRDSRPVSFSSKPPFARHSDARCALAGSRKQQQPNYEHMSSTTSSGSSESSSSSNSSSSSSRW